MNESPRDIITAILAAGAIVLAIPLLDVLTQLVIAAW